MRTPRRTHTPGSRTARSANTASNTGRRPVTERSASSPQRRGAARRRCRQPAHHQASCELPYRGVWRRSAGPAVGVPDLVGLEVRVAQDLALDAGVLAVEHGPRPSPARSGVVIGQVPGPGRRSGLAARCGSGSDPIEPNPTTGLGTGTAAGTRGCHKDLDRVPRPGTSRLRDSGLPQRRRRPARAVSGGGSSGLPPSARRVSGTHRVVPAHYLIDGVSTRRHTAARDLADTLGDDRRAKTKASAAMIDGATALCRQTRPPAHLTLESTASRGDLHCFDQEQM